MRRIILKTFQSPGDVLMLTAAVRDLHAAHPVKFQTDVRTSADALWLHNPHITKLSEHDAGVERIDCHYPLIHQANSRPYHFLHGYVQFLEQRLGVPIPVTRFCGDIHLSAEEKQRPTPFPELGVQEGFWIVIAGGKYDFTAKWWNPASYQAVVDHFSSRQTPCAVRPIQFVQCGEAAHWHPRLKNVIDLVGRTNTREFVVLMHHAAGVVCPVTFAMHLAAAVPMKERSVGNPPSADAVPSFRPCVVIAGAREPAHWEQYPGHQFLHTIGSLPCCASDPCWRSRCQLVGDGDEKDRQNVCERPVQVSPELRIPKCMDMISPDDVIRAIERYVGQEGSGFGVQGSGDGSGETRMPADSTESKIENPKSKILVDFRHGLGDGVQLTTVLAHLRHYHPDWQVDVAVGIGKLPPVDDRRHHAPRDAHHAERDDYGSLTLYHRLFDRDRDHIGRRAYKYVFDLSWDECPTAYSDSPSTKAEHCLKTVFHLQPIIDLCHYELSIGDSAWHSANNYLASICGCNDVAATVNGSRSMDRYPVVLVHYQGNTSSEKKNLPHDLAERVCEAVIESGYVPVILDWDKRTPLADNVRIFNPDADAPLWGASGTGDCEVLAALIAQASLFIGIDSGPLHVAGAMIGHRVQETGNSGKEASGALLPLPLGEGRGEGDLNCADATIPSLTPSRQSPTPQEPTKGRFATSQSGDESHALQRSPTPVLAVWTGHHPLHYFGLADHVTHLVPEDHASRLRGNQTVGRAFFEKHYRFCTYRQLEEALPALVQERLARDGNGLLRSHGFWVRGDNVEQDLVIVRDIAEQDSYRIGELEVPGPIAVDVGAHIGVFSGAFKRRHPSARVVAVECCPENIAAMRRNVGGFATIVPAAMTYERDVALLNAVYPGCASTGGSRVVLRAELEKLVGRDGATAEGETSVGNGLRAVPSYRSHHAPRDVHPAERDDYADDQREGVSPTDNPKSTIENPKSEYWPDTRPLETVTLEQIMAEHHLDRIDVLKLDCEGSEFSILENTTSLNRIGAIIGEYHGRERFVELVARKFANWQFRILLDGDPGTFWLINPNRRAAHVSVPVVRDER